MSAEAERGPALAVFAHPDDAEIAAGGTLAKWAAAGREVRLLVLTNGDRGTTDPAVDRSELARVRAAETIAAAQVLGLAGSRVLDVHDGELGDTPETRAIVVRTIRELRPSTIVSCDPTTWFFAQRFVNHADHRTAGAIAIDSVWPAAGNPHFFPEHLEEGLAPHDVTELWLAWSDGPDHHEDVTASFATKVAALGEHRSQLEVGIRYFEEELEREARRAGERIGVPYAESFRVLYLS
ncbi:MAG TPA: PIG-L deacetylase family protein [Actinomycetota bacterium]|nr:PIG-L deacetylase family protein [Actinomycetota bacterium]